MTTTNEPRTCGRPTKTGKACRTVLRDRYRLACKLHETEVEKAFGDGYEEGYRTGATQERERSQKYAKFDREQAIAEGRRLERAEQEERKYFRERTEDGKQIVVCGRYTYSWDGAESLRVGERVWLPPNWVILRPFIETVTALGSSYNGPLSPVMRRAD